MTRRIGLAHAGGGPKGAFGVGVLRALSDQGWLTEVTDMAGTSVGAVNLGLLAKHGLESLSLLEEYWRELTNDQVWCRRFPLGIPALWKGGLNSTRPLRENFLKPLLGREDPWAFGFEAGAVNLTTGKLCYGQSVDWIEASCAHPVWFEPVKIGQDWYTDGGLLDETPVRRLVERGCSVIIAIVHEPAAADIPAVWAPGMGDGPPNLLARQIRQFELIMQARLQNDLLAPPDVRLHVIRPAAPLDVDMPNFEPLASQRLIQEGMEAGLRYLKHALLY